MIQTYLWPALTALVCIVEFAGAFKAQQWVATFDDEETQGWAAIVTLVAMFVPAGIALYIDNEAWLTVAAFMGTACAGGLAQETWAQYVAHRERMAELRSGDPERVLAFGRELRARYE